MFAHIASFTAILNCSLISTKSATLAKNKFILHFSYCSYLPLSSSYQFTNFILPTRMVKLKPRCGHPWIPDVSLAYVAMLQGEALENGSAKFLNFVLGHKCPLKSVEQLCMGELLKIQLQQRTAFVCLIYVVWHCHPHLIFFITLLALLQWISEGQQF